MISQAESLGSGSRFSFVESSSFKVQLKCHLLCKDSSSLRSKINHPPLRSQHCCYLRNSLITAGWIYVFTSLCSQQDFSRQVSRCSAFVCSWPGPRCACSGCSINEDLASPGSSRTLSVGRSCPEHFAQRNLVSMTSHRVSSVLLPIVQVGKLRPRERV